MGCDAGGGGVILTENDVQQRAMRETPSTTTKIKTEAVIHDLCSCSQLIFEIEELNFKNKTKSGNRSEPEMSAANLIKLSASFRIAVFFPFSTTLRPNHLPCSVLASMISHVIISQCQSVVYTGHHTEL